MKKVFLLSILFIGLGLLQAANAKGRKFTVAKDGSGDFKTVQAAFNTIPSDNTEPVIVFVKNGIYKEKLWLEKKGAIIFLEGEDKFKTVLTYDDHPGMNDANGKPINTQSSQSFMMNADYFTAKNITFQNDAGFTAGQAVAIQSNGDAATYINCRFIGNQDVLFTNNPSSRQYFQDCYIEGTTDFIFGSSTVWFERCHIHSKKNSHVTAASTPQEHEFGYVFHDCVLTGDTSLHNVSLGRPWRPYSSVTYLHCYIGPHIIPGGWNNWGKESNEATARYSEFENYGPGATPESRVSWSSQLSKSQAEAITIKTVFKDWMPNQCVQ